MGLTMALSIGATVVLGYAIKAALGLRPSLEGEEDGLDVTDHGEAGYHPDEGGGHGERQRSAAMTMADETAAFRRPEGIPG
jgi:hypothetical protein